MLLANVHRYAGQARQKEDVGYARDYGAPPGPARSCNRLDLRPNWRDDSGFAAGLCSGGCPRPRIARTLVAICRRNPGFTAASGLTILRVRGSPELWLQFVETILAARPVGFWRFSALESLNRSIARCPSLKMRLPQTWVMTYAVMIKMRIAPSATYDWREKYPT